jgi:hypothetical protein
VSRTDSLNSEYASKTSHLQVDMEAVVYIPLVLQIKAT